MVEFAFENISDAVFHHAALRPDAPAVVYGCETLTYAGFAGLVAQAAAYLGAEGIAAGDHIGLALTNSIERVVLAQSVMRIGATLIELPAEIERDALAAHVSRFAIKAVFVEAGRPIATAPRAKAIFPHWRAQLAAYSGGARYAGEPENLRVIVLSSGSTGTPKGVVATHRHRILRATIHANVAPFWNPAAQAPLLLAAPAETAMVSQYMVTQLMLGGAYVLFPTYQRLIDLIRALGQWADGICLFPPAMARSFLSYAGPSGHLFPAMRAFVVGGQPLAGHDKLALRERLCPRLYDHYGSAAFGAIATIGPEDMAAELESVGRVMSFPGVEAEIAGADGSAVPAGEIGQLRLRGPNLSLGFYNAEDNRRGTERFEGGWYYPGDVGLINQAGYLYIKGRMADAIHVGGTVIYPPEIEDILLRHPGVAEAAVVGRAGQKGEEIIAFVLGKPGLNHQEVAAHCSRHLPPHKRPAYIYYPDRLPRTGNGKIDRPALKTVQVKITGRY